MRAACAIFVKTPGLSPVKTRLAAGIGDAAAQEFYERSWRATASVVQAAALEPFWAVAEVAEQPFWPLFPCIWQGEGDLAQRLRRIYDGLFSKYDLVYLVGADCPQLAAADFEQARSALAAGADFAVGPACDGGFYLLAGTKPIPPAVWSSVPMSQADTSARLCAELARSGHVVQLRPLTDVDTAADLPQARRELQALPSPLAAQQEVLAWIDKQGQPVA